MKLSGFYMANGKNSEGAKDFINENFQNRTKPIITEHFGGSGFEVIDVIRTPEYDEYDEGNGLEAYDVHFILDLPDANIVEDTMEFYTLELLLCTGLGVVED